LLPRQVSHLVMCISSVNSHKFLPLENQYFVGEVRIL
jgi:hypothetical protein